MVNDFGAINIDADLLVSADEDTLQLSNGCVCCTMGTELLYALMDALDRRPRPDFLVIEASGVADPQKIAAAAHAEPDMRYCGVIAMADAANIGPLLANPKIGHQVAGQLEGADLVLVTKTDLAPMDAALAQIRAHTAAPAIEAPRGEAPVELLLGEALSADGAPRVAALHDHGDGDSHRHHEDHDAIYRSWSAEGGRVRRADLDALLRQPPPGLYRFKGRIALAEGGAVEAHLAGRVYEAIPTEEGETRAVAIGVAPDFDPAAFEEAWRGIRV